MPVNPRIDEAGGFFKAKKGLFLPGPVNFTFLHKNNYACNNQVTAIDQQYPGYHLVGGERINEPIFVIAQQEPEDTLPTEKAVETMIMHRRQTAP
jgi:hypothetical protein